MRIKVEDVLTISGEKYTVLDSILYEDKDYILTNKVVNDGPSEIFISYEVSNDGLYIVKEKRILDRILPIFSNNINKKIMEITNKEEVNT